MKNNEMNNLALKFLNSIKGWVEARIDTRTQGCLRTKVAILYGNPQQNNTNLYKVILASDYRELQLLNQKIEDWDAHHSTDPDYEEVKEQLLDEKEELLQRVVFENLIAIRPDTYSNGDYVTIGYVDNKLTNSFIICKNEKEG